MPGQESLANEKDNIDEYYIHSLACTNLVTSFESLVNLVRFFFAAASKRAQSNIETPSVAMNPYTLFW